MLQPVVPSDRIDPLTSSYKTLFEIWYSWLVKGYMNIADATMMHKASTCCTSLHVINLILSRQLAAMVLLLTLRTWARA